MKPVKAIKDPEAFKLLADGTRRKIVFLLRVKEMTVSQLAAELNITPQAVYHHIKKLLKGEMIEVSREERIDHLIESYYRATAETFFCSVGKKPHSLEVAKEQMTTVLNALKKLGFNIEFNENKISQLVNVQTELEEGKSGKFEDEISELDDVDFLTKQMVQKYAETLSMSDQEIARQQKINKKFRDLLRSLLKK
ncbi:MAG: helix-turn-helix domain-containing protein [Candidatus Korarchaeota archaeon]|nr:helix-turn-helix domain-containing protein [Candidatus Korarchaeota archaeon]